LMGSLVSQWAEAIRMACGLPSRLPSAAHAVPAGPACSACIGEPWEMKTLGSGVTALLRGALRFPGQQALGLHCLLHLGPCGDALVERLEVRPLPKIDLRRLGPVGHHEEVGIGDG